MQNRVMKLPCGLSTGSGPRCNSRGTLVTCSAAFCDNEANHVLEFVPREGNPERWGAYCENCPERRIAPAAEVDAALTANRHQPAAPALSLVLQAHGACESGDIS